MEAVGRGLFRLVRPNLSGICKTIVKKIKEVVKNMGRKKVIPFIVMTGLDRF